ncbi:hypothetical protein [Engelhardtia mirabilis]|uniref:Outer membrane efflux protein n=1 Tax=Engelhardtia mirabilis TaxID=2528011 RepID=A0A518BH32_9BACT|nr:hypothetical protein Pla133_13300 [Planctomycetes bacterium Pla133]QDV00590.1 hypothetical protein Pla86_13290 [Planctomycetes bacterium Pla86]
MIRVPLVATLLAVAGCATTAAEMFAGNAEDAATLASAYTSAFAENPRTRGVVPTPGRFGTDLDFEVADPDRPLTWKVSSSFATKHGGLRKEIPAYPLRLTKEALGILDGLWEVQANLHATGQGLLAEKARESVNALVQRTRDSMQQFVDWNSSYSGAYGVVSDSDHGPSFTTALDGFLESLSEDSMRRAYRAAGLYVEIGEATPEELAAQAAEEEVARRKESEARRVADEAARLEREAEEIERAEQAARLREEHESARLESKRRRETRASELGIKAKYANEVAYLQARRALHDGQRRALTGKSLTAEQHAAPGEMGELLLLGTDLVFVNAVNDIFDGLPVTLRVTDEEFARRVSAQCDEVLSILRNAP